LNDAPSIDKILDHWLADCGEEKRSDSGSTFLVIPIADRRGRLLDLIQAMVSYGYTEEDIRSATVSTKVVKTCWSDLIIKMTAQELRKSRDITRKQWEGALNEVFTMEMPKYVKPEKPAAPVVKTHHEKELAERLSDIDPKDRIKVDTSDMVENPLDLELLKELGIDESFVTGKKNE